MIAVNQVVMNRVASDIYPDTPCDVIFQGPHRKSWRDETVLYPVRDRCQFSWYCDGKSDEVSKEDQEEREAWFRAVKSSWEVLDGSHDDLVDGALWYHADYVDPKWNRNKEITSIIGNHIFYKDPTE
tara:strand:- start:1624 stop:2004 length:381 start_codon:yes stop_codon:yes gene_type:complete